MRQTELDRLEEYLQDHEIPYRRIDEENGEDGVCVWNRHQILVYESEWHKEHHKVSWDAICHYGSYGYREGLLEIAGSLVTRADRDGVVGYLTSADVIARIEGRS